MSDSILTERRKAVLWITFNRPEALNAFDDEMGLSFLDALRDASDRGVRAVVVTGAGRAFSAGEDLRALQAGYEAGFPPDHASILRSRYNPAIEAIVGLEKPVLAAINGVAAGAGVSLALACDYRLISEEAKLILAFVNAGLVPDSGATWMLPLYLGVGRAMELSLTGDPIPAAKAKELGLVNQLCPPDDLSRIASEVAETFATGPTRAYGLIKKLIWASSGRELSAHLEAEAEAQRMAGTSDDHLEGVRAFLEKRPPRFEGR